MSTYLQRHGGAPLDHPRRCTSNRQDGKPCRRYAIRGGNVCRVHGGGAPQVLAKARERLNLAADRMARELLGIATGAESEAVKLSAVKDALDRAGLGAKTEVSVEVKAPWEELLGDVAHLTKAQHDAIYHPERAAPPPALPSADIVDAEVVPEAPESPPDSPRERANGVGQPASAPPSFAEPYSPPSRELVTLEEAAAEAARANRAAGVTRARRRR